MIFPYNLSYRPRSNDRGILKPKRMLGKRGTTIATNSESPTKKGKTTKGESRKTKDAKGKNRDNEEITTKTKVKHEDTESDNTA